MKPKKHISTYPIKKIEHIDDLVQCYQYTSQGHFFDKDTMKFFASRLTSDFLKLNDNEFIFRTTEKRCFNDPTRVSTLKKATITKNRSFHGFKIEIETIDGLFGVEHSEAKKYLRTTKKGLSK